MTAILAGPAGAAGAAAGCAAGACAPALRTRPEVSSRTNASERFMGFNDSLEFLFGSPVRRKSAPDSSDKPHDFSTGTLRRIAQDFKKDANGDVSRNYRDYTGADDPATARQ